ncbi:hypothetical protein BK658_17935 [Pseudomonas brassicacearum]|uniref:Uncharacterized protein n=1 Tax=Pseudomonas brassicacearum TaxID=930166 RepID=A0A423GP33_9PSED|nr:hypothetical protein BK658_17935 [Pseudomonas brassicacearum]
MILFFWMGQAAVERKTIGMVMAVGLAVLVGKGMLDSHNRPVPPSNAGSSVTRENAAPSQPSALREPTKAVDSAFDHDFSNISSSRNLTKADLAWHALNTYGWDCEEVVDVQPAEPGKKYSVITCANSRKLRVYPRSDAHPIITNMKGQLD